LAELAEMTAPSVYLETTILSYLAAHPSRDLVVAAHQQITHEWWRVARHRYELFISASVLGEMRKGDPDAAARRLAWVEDLPVLEVNDEVGSLFEAYNKELGLPERATVDVLHIAFAVGFGMDYLLTWNCAHIANGEVVRRLLQVNETLGKPTPVIVTPEELLESVKEK
jgi:hypothetical protein